MFEGLNAIPWANLKHAYGSADEVPMWLCRLASPDDSVCKDAMSDLYGSICHQNWICPATAYAVPYLIELLQEPAVRGKDEILELLADIVESGPFNEMTWRHNPRVPSWEVPAHVPFKDAQAEAAKGISTYIALLDDPDVAVRMQAAVVLSTFHDRAYDLHPILLAAFETETDERAKANLVAALGSVTDSSSAEDALFEELFHLSGSILLRFVAARALALRLKGNMPQEVVDFLADVMLHDPEELAGYEDFPLFGYPDSEARGALYALGPQRLHFLFPLIVQELRATRDRAEPSFREKLRLESLATMLLSIVFPQVKRDIARSQPAPMPTRLTSTLTDDQQLALTTICQLRHIWSPSGDIPSIMGILGLPQTRNEMAKYLQVELPPEDEPITKQNKARQHVGFMNNHLARITEVYPGLYVRHYGGRVYPRGQNSGVITVNDAIIFRFPRHPQAVEEMEREIAILRAIQGRLPIPIPNPTYFSPDTHAVGRAFMGYEKLPGKPLYKEMLESVDGEDIVQQLATQLATFLFALHTTPPDIFPISLPVANSRETWVDLYARIRASLFSHMRPDAREQVAAHFERYLKDPHQFAFTPTLIHGDFGPGNILYDAKARTISGIIDFSSAGLGDPATDIAALLSPAGYGLDFVRRFSAIYPDLGTLIERTHFYIGTFALQEALFGIEQGDNDAFERGIAAYR